VPLGGGGLCLIVASQTSFIDRRLDVGAFDFKDRTRLALPEDSRAERLLETDWRLIGLIVF
jgi:zona occludens toxin (predicted ATPase)